MKCINLKQGFGERFKVRHEESYYADRGDGARTDDPWLQVIPCQNGHICPWGGRDLAACTDKPGSVAKRLKALPFARVAQDSSDGVNAVFDVDHFDEVARVMKPRKRRRLSDEARWRLTEAGAATRYGTRSPENERPCVPTAQDDSQAVQQGFKGLKL